MAAGTLYTYADNFRASKALIAAQYSQADVKVSPNFVFGETNKSKDFLKKFPSGKVPALETNDGKYLQDSNAIAYYVSNEQLRGQSEFDKAQVLQWIGFAESEILPAVCAWVFPILGVVKKDPVSEKAYGRAREDLKIALQILNSHLLTRTYVVGERITLADIVLACNLLSAYKYALEPSYRKQFANVNRWFTTLINQRQFKTILGDVQLVEKAASAFGAAPVAGGDTAAAATSCTAVGEKTNKKKHKKKDEKKEKKQSKKETKPPVEEPDDAELALAQEPKSKDPFETMPKGTFHMDDFKRFYSNEDEQKSIAYFWEKFDPENYSIWFGEYKYPEELTKVFMSCNLIGGMFQRLEKMRKCAFASVCLFGEDNNSSISGVWVWRGQELAFPLCPDWTIDYELYEWKKLDPKSEETKKLVEDYFSWTGTDSKGRKFNQGKIFK